ncbi:MAG: T9SS type A sorting domain-containing protein, partial [Alphaproteobacteria bacterium]|nr:T9SS type A sorting domain-containing protein [Alphaproteobacteria bacterium]
QSIRVVFRTIKYRITASSGANGTISPIGDTLVDFGTTLIYKITPNPGYEIDSLFIDGVLTFNTNLYQFENINKNISIRVIFKFSKLLIRSFAGINGTISPLGDTLVFKGDAISYSIIPNIGYEIDSILINGIKVSNINNFIFNNISDNQTIQVWFKIKTFTISAFANNNGTISPNGDTIIRYGNRPIYNISPNSGYQIDSILVNGLKVLNNNVYQFDSVKENKSIQVWFKLKTFTISAIAGLNGSISPQGDTNVNLGSNISYKIVPNIGYQIDVILVNGIKVTNVNTYQFNNIQENKTIQVSFKSLRYTITSTSGTNGKISSNSPSIVDYGSRPIFTFTPNYGYEIDSITINGIKIQNTLTYQFDSIKENKILQVWFKLIKYTVTALSDRFGIISPGGITNFNFGSQPIYSFIPNFGYQIDSVVVNGKRVISSNPYQFDSLNENKVIQVWFKIKKYKINTLVGLNGTISPNGDTFINSGSNIEYLIKPNNGFEIDSLIINGNKVINALRYTFINVTGDSSIKVVFKRSLPSINLITLTVTNPTCRGNYGQARFSIVDTTYYNILQIKNTISNSIKYFNVKQFNVIIDSLNADTLYEATFIAPNSSLSARTFTFTLSQPQSLATFSDYNSNSKEVTISLSGGTDYIVTVNGKTFTTNNSYVNLPLVVGLNKIQVKTNLECQGVYEESILVSENMSLFPNPSQNYTILSTDGLSAEYQIEIVSDRGQVFYNENRTVDIYKNIRLNLSSLPIGIYLVRIKSTLSNHQSTLLKLIKQ